MSKHLFQMKTPIRIAIVQESPVHLNLPLSLQKAEILIKEAASGGARLIVFGEAWLCGYPAWLDYCPEIAIWGHEPTKEVFVRMHQNGVSVPSQATQTLAGLAKTLHVAIGIGINETVSSGPGNGSIFNSFLFFDTSGELVLHHRKLMPTFSEKLVYAMGDARGLRSVETSLGRIGGLICWEHFMPLSRQTLHNDGEFIHLALWPTVHEIHQVASRHYAFEGRCFVVAAGMMMRVSDIPPELEIPATLAREPEEWLLSGGSCVIAPDGFFDLKPQFGTESILFHDLSDPEHTVRERLTLDASGHYQRPDIFKLEVNR